MSPSIIIMDGMDHGTIPLFSLERPHPSGCTNLVSTLFLELSKQVRSRDISFSEKKLDPLSRSDGQPTIGLLKPNTPMTGLPALSPRTKHATRKVAFPLNPKKKKILKRANSRAGRVCCSALVQHRQSGPIPGSKELDEISKNTHTRVRIIAAVIHLAEEARADQNRERIRRLEGVTRN